VTCVAAFGFSGLRVERLTFRWGKIIAAHKQTFNGNSAWMHRVPMIAEVIPSRNE